MAEINDQHVGQVLAEIHGERRRQHAKWGEQNHPDGTRDDRHLLRDVAQPTYGTLAYLQREVVNAAAERGDLTYAEILLEEVFEAVAEHDPQQLRAELVQLAAVAVAWAEAIDRRDDRDPEDDEAPPDFRTSDLTIVLEAMVAGERRTLVQCSGTHAVLHAQLNEAQPVVGGEDGDWIFGVPVRLRFEAPQGAERL